MKHWCNIQREIINATSDDDLIRYLKDRGVTAADFVAGSTLAGLRSIQGGRHAKADPLAG